jgi:hypothetical protein
MEEDNGKDYNVNVPEPSQEYSPDNQRQVLQSLETLKDQLNFSFQEDLKQESSKIYLV